MCVYVCQYVYVYVYTYTYRVVMPPPMFYYVPHYTDEVRTRTIAV